MRKILAAYSVLLCYLSVALVCIVLLSACDAGSGKAKSFASSKTSVVSESSSRTSLASSSINSSAFAVSSRASAFSASSSSSLSSLVILSGMISYDHIPHNINHLGLNYSAITPRPVRGARIELLDNLGAIKASTITANDGSYSFNVSKNIVLKVRVKAQLLGAEAPSWDFKVTDNTANNALYVLEGGLLSTGIQNSTRNLHANSGWNGADYGVLRAAAPFAILDSIYIGLTRILAVGNKQNLSPLEFRWSTKNSVADGDLSKGEIGTSFYDGTAIYILGDANNDTDEYDPHVLLHEWGHYLEDELFRSDSIGGEHSGGSFLDFRVAMSEGFANAFSCMMLDNRNYADASGAAQSSGFSFDVAKKNRTNSGYFNEASIASIFYNYYADSIAKVAYDFSPVFKVMSNTAYSSSEAFTSIFLFQSQLKNQQPTHGVLFGSLMQEQEIFGVDEYAKDESNNGGLAINLPVYKALSINGLAVNVCSAPDYGKYNKLGNSQFLKLNVAQAGMYSVRINKSGGAAVASKPEFILYQQGRAIAYLENTVNDNAAASVDMAKGNYVLEVYDQNNRDSENTDENMTCFNVQVIAN
jgi:hypothetical protein